MIQASNSSDDKNLDIIKEEFVSQVSSQFNNLKVEELVFLNSETPIFAVLPNNVIIASLGAMKDMITDP